MLLVVPPVREGKRGPRVGMQVRMICVGLEMDVDVIHGERGTDG